jgi:hypothetical protein
MRKLVLTLAAAALLFASCTKEETTSFITNENPNAIGFDFSTGKLGTRAASNDLTALKGDTDGIGIYATNGSTPAEFIANVAYKWNSTTSKWAWDGTDKTWPTTEDGYPINFYAYYPKSSVTLTAEVMTKEYTVGTTMADQKDFLAAKQTGVMTRPSSSNVALDFKHILSKVDFKVMAGSGMTAEVQSITLKNAFSVRTFDYSTAAWATAAATTGADYAYMSAPVITANKFPGTTPAAAVAVTGTSGSLMLIPQDFSTRAWDKKGAPTTSDTYIEVVYRMYETATGKDVVGFTDATKDPDYTGGAAASPGPLFVKVGYPLNTVWEMNKAYTYTIYLGTPDASGGNIVDPNFVDPSGGDSGLPVVDPDDPSPTPTPLPVPSPIVDGSKPIGFTVSVSDWTDSAIDVK